jgi:predicted nucleic acid-binding protein
MPNGNKIRVYFETTIFNRYFDEGREYHEDTVRLFSYIKQGIVEPYTSIAVLDELENAPEPKRSKMQNLIAEYNISVMDVSEETIELADKYIAVGILKERYRLDAVHIAMASVFDIECIVSLNFRHINRLRTKAAIEIVNNLQGYSIPYICTPMEVIEDEI